MRTELVVDALIMAMEPPAPPAGLIQAALNSSQQVPRLSRKWSTDQGVSPDGKWPTARRTSFGGTVACASTRTNQRPRGSCQREIEGRWHNPLLVAEQRDASVHCRVLSDDLNRPVVRRAVHHDDLKGPLAWRRSDSQACADEVLSAGTTTVKKSWSVMS